MVHLRLLLSVLCAVCAVGLALLKPFTARADEPPVAPEPTPASTAPAPQVLPVVKRHPAAARRVAGSTAPASSATRTGTSASPCRIRATRSSRLDGASAGVRSVRAIS